MPPKPDSAEQDGPEAPEPPIGARRRWAGRLAALAFGLLLLCVVELILAVAGYGGPRELFVKLPDGDGTESYVTNYDAFRATFGSDPTIRALDKYPAAPAQRFPVHAPQGTVRICVMGGSAARGYPHRVNAAFPHFLQEILNSVYERPRFEAINVGVTAIGSHSVRERASEALSYDTDLLVVYSGHNEFYGAYGPGSAIPLSSRLWVTRAQMWLRRRRLSLLVGDLMARLLPAPTEGEVSGQLVEIMPRRRDIRHGDPVYVRVRENYRANLEDIVRVARGRGVPVVLCTPAANLRDFPPMASLHGPQQPPEGPPAWKEHFDAAEGLLAAERYEQAAERLAEAVRLSPGHAETHYRLARCLDELGRKAEAAEHYAAARDLDTVRWRAPGDFAEQVRRVAREAGGAGVVLADVAARLAREGEGAPGRRFFLEHVHPTLEGNFAIAEAVARAVTDSEVGARLGRADWTRHGAMDDYVRAAGIDALDVLVARQTAGVLHGTLMAQGADLDEQRAALAVEVTQLQQGLSEAQRVVWEEALRVRLFDRADAYDLLRLLLGHEYDRRGRLEDALAELEKAKRYGYWRIENERYAALFVTEAGLLLKKGDAEGAARAARRALELDPGRPGALRRLEEARPALGEGGPG